MVVILGKERGPIEPDRYLLFYQSPQVQPEPRDGSPWLLYVSCTINLIFIPLNIYIWYHWYITQRVLDTLTGS